MPFIYESQPYGGNMAAKRQQQHLQEQHQLQQGRDSFGSLYSVESELNGRHDSMPAQRTDSYAAAELQTTMAASDDDFAFGAHQPRLSFGGRAYLPVAPEGHTLPPPADDWWAPTRQAPNQVYQQSVELAPTMQVPFAAAESMYPSRNDYYLPPANSWAQSQVAYNPNYALPWSPSCAYPGAQPIGYRAPMLHPRHVQLNERPITPHDTYRYPLAHSEHIYVRPDEPSKEQVNYAMATWYTDQVILHLVKPGMYRPGVGGASDEVWGPAGRERDAWHRIGRTPPDYSKPWGRMGMTETPAQSYPRTRSKTRQAESEMRDPYDVLWNNQPKRSPTLVSFVNDMLQRMSISPMAVVAATWYVAGLGLHEVDGHKGQELRAALREQRWEDVEAVEKRVAMLGLLLAGKWLDDNSFLTKSWNEVTAIPKREIDRLERAALADLHFSLFIPVSSWVDHVNKHFAVVMSKDLLDEYDAISAPILDHMVTEAREVELDDPWEYSHDLPVEIERRLSSEVPPAADQAISRDWGSFARSYSINDSAYFDQQQDYGYSSEVDVEMELGRQVSALVDEEVFDDEEEEFLDYDGAKPWLPSMSDLRRSASHSSAQSFDSTREIQQWRSVVFENPPSQPASTSHSRHTSASNPDWLPAREIGEATYPPGVSAKEYDGVYIEPGISIVRAPFAPEQQPRWTSTMANEHGKDFGSPIYFRPQAYSAGAL